MHSIYDLNQSTDEWESVDMLDIGGGAPFIIESENIYFTANYYVPYITNYTNTIQFNVDGEDVVWLYSFVNEHPFTGEVGNYLLIEENFVYEDGTSDSRIYVCFQP